jgi:Flp pilus assembly pilin Flp
MEFHPMNRSLKKKRERGASLVEFALLVALIAVVAVGATRTLGRNSRANFHLVNCLQVSNTAEAHAFLTGVGYSPVFDFNGSTIGDGGVPLCYNWFGMGGQAGYGASPGQCRTSCVFTRL